MYFSPLDQSLSLFKVRDVDKYFLRPVPSPSGPKFLVWTSFLSLFKVREKVDKCIIESISL